MVLRICCPCGACVSPLSDLGCAQKGGGKWTRLRLHGQTVACKLCHVTSFSCGLRFPSTPWKSPLTWATTASSRLSSRRKCGWKCASGQTRWLEAFRMLKHHGGGFHDISVFVASMGCVVGVCGHASVVSHFGPQASYSPLPSALCGRRLLSGRTVFFQTATVIKGQSL